VFRGEWTKPGESKPTKIAIKVLRVDTNTIVVNKDTDQPLTQAERVDRRLGREMCMWNKVKHPHINPLLGFIKSSNDPVNGGTNPCLISQFHENGDMRGYLQKNPDADRHKLLEQTAMALDYLHTLSPAPIAHLDIKPDNILINDKGDVQICDLGVSKILDGARTGFTTAGGQAHSLPYSSREILMNETPSTASDVYSFGMLILEVLSNVGPYQKETKSAAKITFHTCDGDIPLRTEHPIEGPAAAVEETWTLIQDCCKKDHTKRPKMDYVLRKLHEIRGVHPASVHRQI